LHLKLGDFSRTAAIGDSILGAMPIATGQTAMHLAGIAALLGREHAATTYLRASGTSVTTIGAPAVPILEDVSTALFFRAALGVCDDSLRALHKRLGVLLDSYVNAAQRGVVRTALLQRPVQFAVGCMGAASTLNLTGPVPPVLQALQALGRGDVRRVRFQLDSMQLHRQLVRPGEMSIDFTVAEAWLYASIGDTAAATRQLDLTLTELPTLSSYLVYEPGMTAAVGRSMVFRAELAARHGDAGTAALWAGRVLTLWAHSDASLRPTLARMKALAAHRA
jgi:hypothetical protein